MYSEWISVFLIATCLRTSDSSAALQQLIAKNGKSNWALPSTQAADCME